MYPVILRTRPKCRLKIQNGWDNSEKARCFPRPEFKARDQRKVTKSSLVRELFNTMEEVQSATGKGAGPCFESKKQKPETGTKACEALSDQNASPEVGKKRAENIKALLLTEGKASKLVCEEKYDGGDLSAYKMAVGAMQHCREQ